MTPEAHEDPRFDSLVLESDMETESQVAFVN